MFFNLFKHNLTAVELQDLISKFLMHMVWIDGKAEQKELEIVVRILTHDYHTDPRMVRREIETFNPKKSSLNAIADKLRNNLPVSERIQLRREIWSIALTHTGPLSHERELFYRAARHLGIPDNEFLERCIKVKPGH